MDGVIMDGVRHCDLLKRDKANLDDFWLRDESVEDSASLPSPDVLADEIVEDLRAALEQFEGQAWGPGLEFAHETHQRGEKCG